MICLFHANRVIDRFANWFFPLSHRLINCHYDGSGVRDVFVLENLLSDGYYNFTNESCLNREHMEAVLDSLAYLHGTGLAYRHSTGEGRLEDLQVKYKKTFCPHTKRHNYSYS